MSNYSFFTKVVGVTFENRQQYVKKCQVGDKLELIRDRYNIYDKNAIAVYLGNNQLGHISRELAEKLAPRMDRGENFICHVSNVTGGGDKNYGVNIEVIMVN